MFSNAWRNDLQHPNEFIRGATLRFLGHLREAELLEPLVPSVRQCLVRILWLVGLFIDDDFLIVGTRTCLRA